MLMLIWQLLFLAVNIGPFNPLHDIVSYNILVKSMLVKCSNILVYLVSVVVWQFVSRMMVCVSITQRYTFLTSKSLSLKSKHEQIETPNNWFTVNCGLKLEVGFIFKNFKLNPEFQSVYKVTNYAVQYTLCSPQRNFLFTVFTQNFYTQKSCFKRLFLPKIFESEVVTQNFHLKTNLQLSAVDILTFVSLISRIW